MKECCKCKATDIVHFSKVDDLATLNSIEPMALAHEGFLGRPIGKIKAFVCNNCGYVEFYVTDYPIEKS